MFRLFVGLNLPDGVIARMNIMCSGIPGARWVAPENFHLTLRFIGEVDEPTAEEIDYALRQIEAETLDLTLTGLGTFGKHGKEHTLWVGVAPSPPLAHLQAKIESAIVRAGQPAEERKFTPHVTIARMNRPDLVRLQHFIEGNGLFQAGPFAVEQFTLFESVPGNGGPVYNALTDYPLRLPLA
jgi:2'-5' RNA ligase